ncbi:hypothetical protein ACFQUU_08135 [Herbaspirillum sp. GCM10030257]|uniref:hypothetical protein n=1 Tax=Herbaspirillum sp. GCM10030257 TaxID=3273393 RepID=UPI00360D168D
MSQLISALLGIAIAALGDALRYGVLKKLVAFVSIPNRNSMAPTSGAPNQFCCRKRNQLVAGRHTIELIAGPARREQTHRYFSRSPSCRRSVV